LRARTARCEAFEEHDLSPMETGAIPPGRNAMTDKESEIPWSSNLDRALETARSQRKHVLFDFTAAPM